MSDAKIIEQLTALAKVRGAKVLNRTYVFARNGDVRVKLSPQAVTLLAACFALGAEATHEQVTVAVNACPLKTKQDKMRVFGYYLPALKKAGWITVK